MSETRNRTGERSTSGPKTSRGRAAGQRSGTSSGRSASSRQKSADRVLAVQNARSLGSGTGSTRRTSSSNRRRKRRKKPDFAKILLILIGIAILILCLAVGLKSCAKSDKETEQKTAETTEPEKELKAEITVNGINVHGLTKSEAREQVLKSIGWDMKVTFDGDTKSVENLLEKKVDEVLDKAYSKGESASYTVSTDGLEDAAKAQAASFASAWDVEAKNGSISSYDKTSGEFIFSGAKNGRAINQEKLAGDILEAVKAGDYKKTITASASETQPEITEAQAKASFKRLGTFTTTTTSNKDRNENIRIASSAINGVIIQPGEEFSFNLTTGNRTVDKGYKAAGAYVNGVLVEEPGGGVCQVSSTLYNAVVFSGLKTTERHAHSYEPSYVTPGEDAMVSYDGHTGPDMKFVNNSKTAVGIKTSFSNQKLTVSIYGCPILEDGVTLSMHSEKVKELDPPKPEYVEDPTLQPDEEKEVKAAVPGSRWVTNLVTKKDGVVVSETLLHNSTYNGKPATIKRNTSGTVQSTEGTDPSESSTESASESESKAPETGEPSPGGSTVSPGNDPGSQPGNAQTQGPGDVITPSTEAADGPGSVTVPDSGSGGPGSVTAPTSAGSGSGGPAETAAGPSEVGLIAPIG